MSEGKISDIFTAKDRTLMVAWALPNDGPLTDTDRQQAMDNFTTYIRRYNLTPNQVAKKVGKPRETTNSGTKTLRV